MSDEFWVGEYFEGDGVDAAHINVVAGPRSGPAGLTFTQALSQPSPGHVPFLTVLRPSVPVKPFTVFVPKVPPGGELHGRATWGAAQLGVAKGVHEAVERNVLPAQAGEGWVLTVPVWVDPDVADLDAVYRNNVVATREALRNALTGRPTPDEMREAAAAPRNPFYST